MDHIAILRILHVLGILLLTGITFAAFADPAPSRRRRILMGAGLCSLVAMIAGFGLQGVLKTGFPTWLMVKIVCWLGLSAMAGMAFRKTGLIPVWTALTVVFLLTALVMIYVLSSGSYD